MPERLWPYLITRAGHAPEPGVAGVGGAPVRALEQDDLSVWVSEAADGPIERDLESIERHNGVIVAAISPDLTPVPLRFGQVAGAEALCASLEARADHWRMRLEEFAGAAEFGLRVTAAAAGDARARIRHAEPQPGRRFLERIAARRQRAEAMRAAIGSALAGLVRREQIETASDESVIARAAHLVPTGGTDSYREALARLAAEHPDVSFHSSGPWPPYSFAA